MADLTTLIGRHNILRKGVARKAVEGNVMIDIMIMETVKPVVVPPSPLSAELVSSSTQSSATTAKQWLEDGIARRSAKLIAAKARSERWLEEAMAKDRERLAAYSGADDHWVTDAVARNSR